jgi:phenylalanyl-tRNA synthetase alpha chain
MSNSSKLHSIERSILQVLATNERISTEKIAHISHLGIDQVRRGIEWLKFKNLIFLIDKSITIIMSASNIDSAVTKELPERTLVKTIKEKGKKNLETGEHHISIKDLFKQDFSFDNDTSSAFQHALRNKWIEQRKTFNGEKEIVVTPLANDQSAEEKLLEKLNIQKRILKSNLDQEELQAFDLLKKRPGYLIEKKEKTAEIFLSSEGKQLLLTLIHQPALEERRLTAEMITSGKWRNIKFSQLDVESPVQSVHMGRKHPLTDIIDQVKEIFVGMGFTEIDGPIIQSSFWNFDVLFTPQDHSAREMQDTFYVSGIKENRLPRADLIKKISETHRNGWKYEWDIEEAKRIVLRTHTTTVTINYLAENKPEKCRIFSIGRVFRNEKVSYKHLIEFNQVEGIVTDPNVTLRDLIGLQTEFYKKLGINRIKFWPTYFPYTEPSLQSMIYIESFGKWVELFGMGILRPEITSSIGIKNPVLAWGGGLERIAMLRFGLNDVRDLYRNDLKWLRSVPFCPL